MDCNTSFQRNPVCGIAFWGGVELSGKRNCIELRPILSDCKVRNPQNLAGSVPNVPTSANILTQKKEQKSLLLKFVIPAVWEIVAMMHKVSKSCESFLTCAYTTLTMSTIFPLLLLLIIVRVVNTLHKGFAVVNLDK